MVKRWKCSGNIAATLYIKNGPFLEKEKMQKNVSWEPLYFLFREYCNSPSYTACFQSKLANKILIFLPVLRIRVRDPVAFLTLLDPGWVKKNKIRDQVLTSRIIFQELRNNFWVKILKFFDADRDPGSGIFLTLDPGWKNSDPGSATLFFYLATFS